MPIRRFVRKLKPLLVKRRFRKLRAVRAIAAGAEQAGMTRREANYAARHIAGTMPKTHPKKPLARKLVSNFGARVILDEAKTAKKRKKKS